MSEIAGVLVTRKFPDYKDIPGVRYHYPKRDYDATMSRLLGSLVLFYEPRRGGSSSTSKSGGRSAFIGMGFVDRITSDDEEPSHAYAWLRFSISFISPIHINQTNISGKALQTAVLQIPYHEALGIVRRGLELPRGNDDMVPDRHGLADVSDLVQLRERDTVEVVRDVRVRDAAFRYQIVEVAYKGRCAFSGLRQTNGFGRAEADAAHIVPVASHGPDIVRNGLAISKTLHWAFDRGLISLSDEGEILKVDRGLDGRIVGLLNSDGRALLPEKDEHKPHSSFLRWHRENVFKGAA